MILRLARTAAAAIALVVLWQAATMFLVFEDIAAASMRGRPLPPGFHFRLLVGTFVWAAITPLIVYAVRRAGFVRQPSWRRAGVLVALVLAFGMLRSILGTAVAPLIDATGVTLEDFRRSLLIRTNANVLLAGVVAALVLLWDFRELKAQLTAAQLQQLRTQLRPHFLFNTLNTIAALVHSDPRKADEMITSLSDLLRASLELGDRQQVPLAQELAFVDQYLSIQKTRFGERLRIRKEVADDVLGAQVPTFLLQPLVENAIVHSIAPRRDGGTLTIRARGEAKMLRIEVWDDGLGFDAARATEGVGLANTKARLAGLFGDRQRIEFHRPPEGGFAVDVALPEVHA